MQHLWCWKVSWIDLSCSYSRNSSTLVVPHIHQKFDLMSSIWRTHHLDLQVPPSSLPVLCEIFQNVLPRACNLRTLTVFFESGWYNALQSADNLDWLFGDLQEDHPHTKIQIQLEWDAESDRSALSNGWNLSMFQLRLVEISIQRTWSDTFISQGHVRIDHFFPSRLVMNCPWTGCQRPGLGTLKIGITPP